MINFLKKLFFPKPQSAYMIVQATCNKCGETLETRINLNNDLSIEYDERGEISNFVVRKVLMGSNRCYQKVEMRLEFSPQKKITAREITGGVFVE